MSTAVDKFSERLQRETRDRNLPAQFAWGSIIIALLQYVVVPLLQRWLCPPSEEQVARAFVKGKGKRDYRKGVLEVYFNGDKNRYEREGGDKLVESYISAAKQTPLREARELVRAAKEK